MDVAWLVLKGLLALAVALGLYTLGARVVRMFATVSPEAEPGVLEPVDYRYRCLVCGTEVRMTTAPSAEVPTPPRHCMEEMSLVVEAEPS